jgi:hypothetical protein
VRTQDAGARGRIGGDDHLLDLVEAETGPLAAQGGSYSIHVIDRVATPAACFVRE